MTGNPFLNALIVLCLFAPLTIAGELCARLLPEHDGLCLDNVILARKPSDA